MFLLPGADGNWSCNERGNERMMDGNCCFIISERLARDSIARSLLCRDGTLKALVEFTWGCHCIALSNLL